ncbi:bifunctional diaminohydroxyphosphoribosylaminopyrimidine deaminase/5-amino-6-(5-phosphoribosylamino)uracil reductase RibD [Oceanisphaera avium]|uniref:Riboflavin biosynthesis protein RibD n=1 Tax=Oceanisphaera avium TaxID=1903694 RepID=A0A1Y0CX90_9GAMM|nr:bifunctional diaminohydroxyphosphoribosylaminopyrimidine deaminase/5-amino-6-(5-phosphoribosylamino)uracil reductase RibD [Oceanisphaera avium]ART79878.1 riboflavin biosynthesis protein RibD [Oceanisphaera avium]
MFSAQDARWMARAIALARRGCYTTSPNPAVGCVIVKHDRLLGEDMLLGEGCHRQAGGPHAEVFALRQAGARAEGATAYVTLEPCAHTGRTPPCAKALIDAKVARVVVACVDANPQVAGKGLAMLEAAGIMAQAGLMAEEAQTLNTGFMHRMRTGLPYVTLKLAASLDGRTALANGQSKWITGPHARRDVQRHRALSCAILSGADTVIMDNASLNVRWSELPASVASDYGEPEGFGSSTAPTLRQPLRVIIDTRNRLTPSLKLFSLPGPILLLRSHASGDFNEQVEECVLPLAPDGKLDLSALMQELGRRQINHLWVEAGAQLAGALLGQQLVHELILYQAPKLMGNSARGLFNLAPLTDMSQVIDLEWQDVRFIGNDLKLSAHIRYHIEP